MSKISYANWDGTQLIIKRKDGKPVLFSNIEDDLKCSNGTTLDPPYLPYPPIDGQNEINIAEVPLLHETEYLHPRYFCSLFSNKSTILPVVI